MRRRQSLSNLLIISLVIGGCVGQAAKGGTKIVAIDTSDSAAGQKGTFYQATMDGLMALPLEDYTVVYRFDAKPAEIHSGPPPASTEEAAKLLKRAVEHRTDQKGTNLAKLILLMDRRLDELTTPIEIQIYTDCGIELMTEAERQSVKRITSRWHEDNRITKVSFLGLRDGYREDIRSMVAVGSDKLEIDNL
jgi:hypothetical protein